MKCFHMYLAMSLDALQMQYTLLQNENRGLNSPILGIWKQHQDYISLTI